MEFSCVDDMSGSVGEMQGTTDPAPAAVESLATSGNGEIQRLRFMFARMLGLSQWYQHTDNVNFATGANVQGSGLGRHVTAVGYHSWSGFTQGAPRPAQFPAITSIADHWTGIAWPARGHLSIVIGDVVNEGGGVKGGVELIRVHALGTIYHHTAALMFAHSAAFSAGQQSSVGHITAIAVSRGLVSAAGNEAAGRDTLLFGHAGTVMQMVGYGASHIALGTNGYVALGRHATASMTPVKNALYASTIVKAWAAFDGTAASPILDMGFGVSGLTDNGTGDWTLTWITPFAEANYAVVSTCTGSRFSAMNTAPLVGSVRILCVSDAGTVQDSFMSVIAVGNQ